MPTTYPTQTAKTWQAHCIARIAYYEAMIRSADEDSELLRDACKALAFFQQEIAPR